MVWDFGDTRKPVNRPANKFYGTALFDPRPSLKNPGVATGDDLRSEFTVRGSDFNHMNFTVDGFSTPFLLHTVRAIEDTLREAAGKARLAIADGRPVEGLERAWIVGGGYKYLQLGEGNCFLRVPPGTRMRPVLTGWFAEFAAARRTHLRRIAYALCGDWHKADDLLQTALTKLYVAWPRIRHEGGEEAYVRQIMVRANIDDSRRPWRRERPGTLPRPSRA